MLGSPRVYVFFWKPLFEKIEEMQWVGELSIYILHIISIHSFSKCSLNTYTRYHIVPKCWNYYSEQTKKLLSLEVYTVFEEDKKLNNSLKK